MTGFCLERCLVMLVGSLLLEKISAFSLAPLPLSFATPQLFSKVPQYQQNRQRITQQPPLQAAVPDLDVVGLVAGQENYGLAIVAIGEALWSFAQAPSFDHAKILVPALVAAGVLGAVSGPMITSGDAASVATGLWIATGVSVGLGASYVARLAAPFSPSAKEIAALGLLIAVAGFFSFSQNLVVDGFVSLPSIDLPSLPEINLPSFDFDFDEAAAPSFEEPAAIAPALDAPVINEAVEGSLAN